MDLKDKAVLVTGGAKRIGRAIALAFGSEKSRVFVHYRRSKEEADTLVNELRSSGVEAQSLAGDLSTPDGIEGFLKTHAEVLSQVSVLVNNASVFNKTPLETLSDKDWQTHMTLNAQAALFLSREIGLNLKKRSQKGAVINITDASLARPAAGYDAYFASKGALASLTQTLARELAPEVRVNAVAPGAILFPEGYTEDQKSAVLKRIPLGKLGTPEQIAQACVFLAKADYMTGATLVVDGGKNLA